jgi:hypothetical protein
MTKKSRMASYLPYKRFNQQLASYKTKRCRLAALCCFTTKFDLQFQSLTRPRLFSMLCFETPHRPFVEPATSLHPFLCSLHGRRLSAVTLIKAFPLMLAVKGKQRSRSAGAKYTWTKSVSYYHIDNIDGIHGRSDHWSIR